MCEKYDDLNYFLDFFHEQCRKVSSVKDNKTPYDFFTRYRSDLFYIFELLESKHNINANYIFTIDINMLEYSSPNVLDKFIDENNKRYFKIKVSQDNPDINNFISLRIYTLNSETNWRLNHNLEFINTPKSNGIYDLNDSLNSTFNIMQFNDKICYLPLIMGHPINKYFNYDPMHD